LRVESSASSTLNPAFQCFILIAANTPLVARHDSNDRAPLLALIQWLLRRLLVQFCCVAALPSPPPPRTRAAATRVQPLSHVLSHQGGHLFTADHECRYMNTFAVDRYLSDAGARSYVPRTTPIKAGASAVDEFVIAFYMPAEVQSHLQADTDHLIGLSYVRTYVQLL
jgi:hypothetical protein